MNNGVNGEARGEPSLIKLYMELTGASESRARSVFMFVCCNHTVANGGAPIDLRFTPARPPAPTLASRAQDHSTAYTAFPDAAIPAISSA